MPRKPAVRALVLLLSITPAVASDSRRATKLSDLPSEARMAISAALENEVHQYSIDATLQRFTLTASDGANEAGFGASVAVDGNTVVVGAPREFVGDGIGEAYVFVRPGTGWQDMTQVARLTASDGGAGNQFGVSVSINGNTIVVGAQGASAGENPGQGAAYVFVKPGKRWQDMTENAKLTASDGAAFSVFGAGVSISGNTIVVGAPAGFSSPATPGRAYVFVEPVGGWTNMTETAELSASDETADNDFGQSVSINGGALVVGAYEASCTCDEGPGSAYVFVQPEGGWITMTETAKLTASDGQIGDAFGLSVSIVGRTVAIGAPLNQGHGAAYVFVEPANGWSTTTETAKLSVGGLFGWSVAQAGKGVIVGALNAAKKGAAYLFLEPAPGWSSTSHPNLTFSYPFSNAYDDFGVSVAISGLTAVVGADRAPTIPPCKKVCNAGPGEAFIFTKQ